MHTYGYVGSQYRGNEVSSARGDVDMHDLGLRVAGKFPGTSWRDSFCPKKLNSKQNPYRTLTQAGISHALNLAKANTQQQPQKTRAINKIRHLQTFGKTQHQQSVIGNQAKQNIIMQQNTHSTSRKPEIICKHAQTNEKTNRNNTKLVQPSKVDTYKNCAKLGTRN